MRYLNLLVHGWVIQDRSSESLSTLLGNLLSHHPSTSSNITKASNEAGAESSHSKPGAWAPAVWARDPEGPCAHALPSCQANTSLPFPLSLEAHKMTPWGELPTAANRLTKVTPFSLKSPC